MEDFKIGEVVTKTACADYSPVMVIMDETNIQILVFVIIETLRNLILLDYQMMYSKNINLAVM
jgi:hypothetical protein